jgi:hypothetical protein
MLPYKGCNTRSFEKNWYFTCNSGFLAVLQGFGGGVGGGGGGGSSTV